MASVCLASPGFLKYFHADLGNVPIGIAAPPPSSWNHSSRPRRSSGVDYNIIIAAFGLKYRVLKNLVLTGNVLVKLNDGGLRSTLCRSSAGPITSSGPGLGGCQLIRLAPHIASTALIAILKSLGDFRDRGLSLDARGKTPHHPRPLSRPACLPHARQNLGRKWAVLG